MGSIYFGNTEDTSYSEKERIVGKLDELVQFCDELEESIKASQQQNEWPFQQVLQESLRKEVADI